MVCRVIKDTYGTLYQVPAALNVKTPALKRLDGSPLVDVWWDRDHTNKSDECLILRQENEPDHADVITLTQGQVYDLIHALGWAIMRP